MKYFRATCHERPFFPDRHIARKRRSFAVKHLLSLLEACAFPAWSFHIFLVAPAVLPRVLCAHGTNATHPGPRPSRFEPGSPLRTYRKEPKEPAARPPALQMPGTRVFDAWTGQEAYPT